MDDSEQDFVDLCSKLLKRVRKKPGEPRQLRKEERQPSSQTSDGDKRKKNQKGDGDSRSKCARTQPVLTVAEAEQDVVCGRPAYDSVDTGRAERGLSVKDKVLQRMQQFKRASPEKIRLRTTVMQHVPVCLNCSVLFPDRPDPVGSDCHLEAEDSDEALALRLQQELDREAAQAETINLEDGGLFFCHLCHRDLTRMTPEGRTQHVNRCLDESEESAPALLPPPPPAPGVPDCPICGKKFKSQKSRSAHLKRCSSDMGVAPAVLLQALQRQAEETQNVPTASRLPHLLAFSTESGGTKRKGPSKPGLPAKKKPRRKAESLDNDTMVALALSSSLLEQERESERVWRPEAGTLTSHTRLPPTQMVAMVRLAADLGSMVNNPQLSDVQLQVDSGEVYFAHSFMVYARCPLLAEMVHESGFGVQEEGVPAAQRVLMSDVPGQAVFALLQYLYTADCSIPASLRPHVLELASRSVSIVQDVQHFPRATGTDEGQDEEKAENVNEQELEEIYEFAATQRKKEEEKESMEEEEEEDKDAEVFTKLGETKRRSTGFSVKNLQTNPVRELDPSLDRSYNRLFSDSWGAYEEGDPSSVPSTSGQSKTHSPQSQKQHSPHKSSSKLSHRAFLQSSADNLYLCPPPSTSNLPVPGQSPSPDLDSAVDLDAPKDALLLKPESEGPRSICAPLSPDSPQLKKEPELIVLSDSSSEMEVVLSSRSPSPQSPHAVEDPQSYTQIRPQQVPKPSEPALEDKKSSNVQFSPDHSAQSCPGCSPEVSWLIPSTPLQCGGSTSSSSTQTRSSICRTQLFPKHDSSSLVLSSPALPLNSKLQPLSSSTRTEKQDGVLKIKLEGTAPYSSTPLHNELHQPPAPLVTSPLLSSFDKQRSASQGRQRTPSDSLERTELGSFHLSPLSDPLDPPSISSHRAHQSSQRGSDSPRQSRQSEFSIHESAGTELIRKGVKDEEAATESKNEDLCHEGQQREPTAETGVTDSRLAGSLPVSGSSLEACQSQEQPSPLRRFGVRPLPKRQMILKLKEIHQYTHQLVNSDSEDEAPSAGQMKPPAGGSEAAASGPLSCDQAVKLKEPGAPAVQPGALPLLGRTLGQQRRRYTQILQYQPVVLSQLQERLKAAGIRLGNAKLVDYLDSQCITFTTAEPGQSAGRGRGRKTAKKPKAAGENGARRKRGVTATL
uniref:Structure-specific endonuclease subunit SLX4 n=1 Tax=Mola mola TaxID=94237 RepID=A0A3Q3XHM8_MOLML